MIQEILNRLTKVRRKGKDSWIACCPAHDDKNPSLAIAVTPDERILLKCFAGCEAIEIVHAIGLEVKDLFPQHGLNPYGTMQKLTRDHERQTEQQKKIDHAKTVMMIYESDKANGKKISREDRNLVFEAYELLRGSNENN